MKIDTDHGVCKIMFPESSGKSELCKLILTKLSVGLRVSLCTIYALIVSFRKDLTRPACC